jgi:hypothetical protein
MKTFTTLFTSLNVGALGTALCLLSSAGTLSAQDAQPPENAGPPPGNFGPPPGNFDPAQMRQRMIERMREQLAVTDDAEWKAISDRVAKVMDARRSLGGLGGPGGGMGFFGPGGPPMRERPAGAPPGGADAGPGQFRQGPGGPQGPGGFNREPSPELDALRKAIQAQAPAAEIKAKLADLRAVRAKKEADLASAQEELRQLLSVRQEAVAVTLGLLK